MATTYVIMDFTPESHAGNLVDTFSNIRLPRGKYSPTFLDFNGDRRVNATDVTICGQQVASEVAGFYRRPRGYDVRIYYGDVTTQSNWGAQWINYGKAIRNYRSGRDVPRRHEPTERHGIGMAPVARDSYNFEGYGETYTRAIGNWMASNRSSATASEFVDRVARVAARQRTAGTCSACNIALRTCRTM